MNLYLSAAESPRSALVASQLNPVPIKLRDLFYGDNVSANIYIADGLGGFDARSGDPNYSISAAIGTPGSVPIWLDSTWTQIANGWSGAIQTDAAGFGTQFSLTGMNPIELILEVKIKNIQGAISTLAQIPALIYNDEIGGSTPNPDVLVNAVRGSFNLVQGADSGTITGLGLVTAPVQVLLHPIRKPVGGLNLYATPVNGTLTQDGFSFTLTGQPDGTGYWLDYVICFS